MHSMSMICSNGNFASRIILLVDEEVVLAVLLVITLFLGKIYYASIIPRFSIAPFPGSPLFTKECLGGGRPW